jgi:hypothetical protein
MDATLVFLAVERTFYVYDAAWLNKPGANTKTVVFKLKFCVKPIRIFQNGDEAGFKWNYGGRLYSQPPATNYQQLSKRARLKMTFNGEAVAEIDIRASYLTLFYGWYGEQLDFNSDPYRLPGFGAAGRDAVKLWMVATFGSPKPISKWPTALLKEYEEDRPPTHPRYQGP